MIKFDTFKVIASFGEDFSVLLKRQLNYWIKEYPQRKFVSFQVVGYLKEEFKIMKVDPTEKATVVICYEEEDK